VATLEEEIALTKGVTPDELHKLHGEYLGGQAGEIALVGDFSPEEAVAALTTIFGDWKAQAHFERMPSIVHPSVKGGALDINTPDKANANYFAAMAFPLRDDHPDYPALVMGNYILGGGSLSSRLADRVRQKEGLSYGVASGLQASSLDERCVFYMYAICNPENMAKVKTALREELERILKEGVTEEELETAKKGYLQSVHVGLSDDANLVQTLQTNLSAGRTMQYYADLESQIEKLTPAQVVEALRKHVDPKQLFVVAAGDFEAAKAKAAKEPAAAPSN